MIAPRTVGLAAGLAVIALGWSSATLTVTDSAGQTDANAQLVSHMYPE